MDIAAILDSMTGAGRVLTVPWGIDYFSIIVGAITGALFACERKLDTVGTVVLGLITAYGGTPSATCHPVGIASPPSTPTSSLSASAAACSKFYISAGCSS